MKYLFIPFAFLVIVTFCFMADSCNSNRGSDTVRVDINAKPFEKISDYGFFKDGNDLLKPNTGVIPYKLVNYMFNDHSLRESFIYIPQNKSMDFDSANVLGIPVGSCLINIVYFWKDERKLSRGKQLIETQLLLRKQTGWEAFDYIWNEDQSDAILSDIGAFKSITWTAKDGLERQVDFVIPGKNQCKSCHWYAEHISPIGIKPGNLNLDMEYPSGRKNQLEHWAESGILKNFTSTLRTAKYPDWKDTLAPLEQRVRSYLDANCAHCHNPGGPGYISGLFLNWDNYNMETYGICKSPPSAGKGSCNLKYDIVPGRPGESIIVCRMAATELGIKMPQLGRSIVDNEGVSLIIQWIEQLKGDCEVK